MPAAYQKEIPFPGEIFKEYTYDGKVFGVLDAYASFLPSSDEIRMREPPGMSKFIMIDDLEDAVSAEVIIEYWGGHTGTTGQTFKINGNDLMDIPQPVNTETEPQCYYRTVLGTPPVKIPLGFLKTGNNQFQFFAGKQIERLNFKFGLYWVYSFTVRVYYSIHKLHPVGEIGIEYNDCESCFPKLSVRMQNSGCEVKSADFLGFYEDFDWRGMGNFEQWQYQYRYGKLDKHIGTVFAGPLDILWDTTWIPDQNKPVRVCARITDAGGMSYMTNELSFELCRKNRSVRIFKAADVPEAFGSRIGQKKICKIIVDDLKNAKSAHIAVSTWSAAHADEIGLNDIKLVGNVGLVHDYSYDRIPVSLDIVKQGVNTFYVYSETEHHAAEINWPGPALIVEYETK
ncbi:MAG: hypothetical protein FIA99_01100 [Ruminiclostridium sp.]|nr:hypothetical protein [Ruminiclostridium sp.]